MVGWGLQHACLKCNRRLEIEWVEAAELEEDSKTQHPEAYQQAWARLSSSHAVLVPGGFGSRGVEGMVLACRHARSQVSYHASLWSALQCVPWSPCSAAVYCKPGRSEPVAALHSEGPAYFVGLDQPCLVDASQCH